MINKILFTIFVIVAIWKAFSLISRLQKEGGIGGILGKGPGRQAPEQASKSGGDGKAVEMIACPRCGAYIDPRERCSCLT